MAQETPSLTQNDSEMETEEEETEYPYDNPLDQIYAASDGQHLWYLKTNPPQRTGIYHILHHGPGMQTAQVEYVTSINRLPELFVARDSELYIIFPTVPVISNASTVNRSVVRVKAVEYDSIMGGWRFSPAATVETIASLPGNCRLIDAATDADSLLVLLEYAKSEIIPEPYLKFTGTIQNPSIIDKSDSYILLLKLQNDNWEPVPLPQDLSSYNMCRLVYGFKPTLLLNPCDPVLPSQGIIYQLEEDNSWASCPVDMNVSLLDGSFSFFSNPGLVFSITDIPNDYEIAYLRDCKIYPITHLSDIAGIHKLIMLHENISVLEKTDTSENLLMSQINIATGINSDPVSLGMPSRISRDDFRRMILIGGLFIAALVMFLSRPDPTKIQMNLPTGTVLAKPVTRLFAVIIDMSPAILITQSITGTSIAEILKSPVIGKSLDDLLPSLIVVGICLVHSFICEVLWGKTLGKWLLNCKVIHIAGHKANILQILIRNTMKGIAIIVPPLSIFIYLNPARQRIGDLAARTIVITDIRNNEITNQE